MNHKTAFVTGCSRGLGRFISIKLYQAGYKVYGVSRTPFNELDEELKRCIYQYYSVNLSDRVEVDNLMESLPLIQVAFFNASHRNFESFELFRTNDIYSLIDSSFTNQLVLFHSILKGMHANNNGKVIFISSKAAFKGFSSGSLYCSLKAAWYSIFESVSRDFRNTQIQFISFIPDSFSNNKGKTIAFNSKVELKIESIIMDLENIRSNQEIRVLKLKTKFILVANRLKQILSI